MKTRTRSLLALPLLLLAAAAIANSPPNAPTYSGQAVNVRVGDLASLTFGSTDPDGDPCFVVTDWGDGATTASGYIPSGGYSWTTHSYATAGTYQVTASSTDPSGATGPASNPVTVTAYNPVATSVNLLAYPTTITAGHTALLTGALRDQYGYQMPGTYTYSASIVSGKGSVNPTSVTANVYSGTFTASNKPGTTVVRLCEQSTGFCGDATITVTH